MKILAFNGSPKANKSNTHKMIREILKGCRAKGADTENIFIADKKIEQCLGCFNCWRSNEKDCVHEDDMKVLIRKFNESDIVVYGTPLYTDNISGLLKLFIDRFISNIPFKMEKDFLGEYRHANSILNKKPPKFVIVSNAAFLEQSQFQVISHFFQRYARSMHTEVIAEIYRSQGIVLQGSFQYILQQEGIEGIIEDYKQALYNAGMEIATDLKIKEYTKSQLEKPFLPEKVYVNSFHNMWSPINKR